MANLQNFTHQVAESKAPAYKVSVTTALKAGLPFQQKDKLELEKAVKAQVEQALRDAEAIPSEATPSEATPSEHSKVAVPA
ncbi:unnamed protein product [marine sediment metagenome]|uniref:Uncharacterized protein n=1 Tax=marine sediment metagenome TaxID=412755 RepID=X1F694_9ZZZZ